MDTPATSWKHAAFSTLDAEACQPSASVGSISPPRAGWRLMLGLHPPQTMTIYRKGGHNCDRNCRIPRISPPAFCTEAKVSKEGAYLRDTMVHVRKNVPSHVYFNKMISVVQFAAWLNHQKLLSIYFNAFDFHTWQQIHFGDDPVGSKGFSRHPCHAFQGKCSSTRQGHSISATCYTPHSPVISYSSVHLHISVSSHTALEVYTAFTHAHCPVVSYSPCSVYLVQQWFPAPSPLLYTSNYFLTLMTVKLRVFCSGHSSYAHFHSTSEP